MRICFDIYTALACNYFDWDLYAFTEQLLTYPHITTSPMPMAMTAKDSLLERAISILTVFYFYRSALSLPGYQRYGRDIKMMAKDFGKHLRR